MARAFDPGPTSDRFLDLMETFPGPSGYPWDEFRLEWGPVFYRGRLDGTARVLAIGQDPAEHECIARRALVGTAGRRVQGFLAKLGINRRYVIVNAFLYCVWDSDAALARRDAPGIREDRDAWLTAIFDARVPDVVIAFGGAAETMYSGWRSRHPARPDPFFRRVRHPTWPNSSGLPLASATATMLDDWNEALDDLFPHVSQRDVPTPTLIPYGTKFRSSELPLIPREDLPAGAPPWMRGPSKWADRVGDQGTPKRARIEVTVPPAARGWA